MAAVRFLRSKLSERIFTNVLEDAGVMPHRLVKVKGLPPLASQGTKIAPLGRDSAIGSTMPIKNMTFQSFKSAKGKSGPILIHGRRNFSSCPPGTKNIRKMDAGKKGSSRPGTEKISGVKGDSDSSMLRSEMRAKIFKVYAVVFCSVNCFAYYYTFWDFLCSEPYLFSGTMPLHVFSLLLVLGVFN